ncbi:hypothetical protein I3842_Q142300 [Carya illinoinensis]|uniref:Uncharacterized protein n=1 Tax=Carya illinoinensis TaxID=32201 RepID=A0A922D239_CARIL|nr:hypothetical protein I3842_Q142300 [Carya illinoinensis]
MGICTKVHTTVRKWLLKFSSLSMWIQICRESLHRKSLF